MLGARPIVKLLVPGAKLRCLAVCPGVSSQWWTHGPRIAILLAAALGVLSLPACSRKPNTPPPDGSALFVKRCASFHTPGNDIRAPEPPALHLMCHRCLFPAL